MNLNIKSDEAYRLARQLAKLTGESMTEAVTRALGEPLCSRATISGDDFGRRFRATISPMPT